MTPPKIYGEELANEIASRTEPQEPKLTNLEKYYEVFGYFPEVNQCPSALCDLCPANNGTKLLTKEGCNQRVKAWWNEPYKERRT